jgi:lipopolysaccharide transport system ATP-binding protein
MSDTVIRVESLGKKYLIRHQGDRPRYTALRDVLADKAHGLVVRGPWSLTRRLWSLAQNRSNDAPEHRSTEEFWALQDVSFEVKQGDVLGIIGRNGAGKSTLLKILSRITEPTEGRVRIRGRVASLLEVGTGFHAELTGRENIFLNGAILGMTRAEIKRKFDEIVAFAEIEKFLDTPVKRYSSGMYVRLAFAVAAHLEPGILIVDEVLAVGDADFQKKCFGKMEEASREQGRTVLFVSHNLQAVRNLCRRGIVLGAGRKRFDGETRAAVEAYVGQGGGLDTLVYETASSTRRMRGSDLARIERVWFTAGHPRMQFGDRFQVQVQVLAAEALPGVCFDLTFFNLNNEPVGTSFSMKATNVCEGRSVYQLTVPSLRFAPGRYYCDLALLRGNWLCSPRVHDVVLGILQFEVEFPQREDGTTPVWHANWGATVSGDIAVAKIETAEAPVS